jgi:hypothetical protein
MVYLGVARLPPSGCFRFAVTDRPDLLSVQSVYQACPNRNR